MLSPKMQRAFRVHDSQVISLAEQAFFDHTFAGFLQKRSGESNKWHLRWFVLYQNILFYYDSDKCNKPHGMLFLEHSYCNHLITPASFLRSKEEEAHCFAISFKKENNRQYEFRTFSEEECQNWIDHIRQASFTKLVLQKEQLEQKHLHLLQVMESERTAKWQYTQQCEELVAEIKKLRTELLTLKKQVTAYSSSVSLSSTTGICSMPDGARLDHEPDELKKVRKVQSFFRGWLCRRRWKQIVEQYIKSPHAENMRKRNSLVFLLVESEEEYVEQMEVLVSCFLRPFKMAASSKKPPCTHEDVNTIFLNSETVLFLHQIFFKGLSSRLENWPTLVLGDLFNMLLPMLNIYQEYVRNHHYSLQVLTECKQSAAFAALVNRLENKAACRGRSLEALLTYPMHQVPRYIITLHELLAHTPHDHVERKSLQDARQQLEDLSRQIHDEISETENLRKNLAIERMIVEGCDILLDVNQIFVRQGTLVQLPSEKPKNKLNFKQTEKEAIRQCFLFSNHLIIATRATNGKLNLVPIIGKLSLTDITLLEEPTETQDEDATSTNSASQSSVASTSETSSGSAIRVQNTDFKIIIEPRIMDNQSQITIHFVAHTTQERDAWVSDINQCLFNVQFNGPNRTTLAATASAQVIKSDSKLFKDEADIRFSKTLNSCHIPQIRYATPQRLLQRLTDLRFLSIDFLNTFLLTYRVFIDGVTVLEALKKVFFNSEVNSHGFSEVLLTKDENALLLSDERRRSGCSPRRTSGASSVSGYYSEMSERDRSHSYDSQGHRHWKSTMVKYEEEPCELASISSKNVQQQQLEHPRIVRQSPVNIPQKSSDSISPPVQQSIAIKVEKSQEPEDTTHLSIPKVAASSSSETLTDATLVSAPSSPGNLSSKTLVEGSSSESNINQHVNPTATTSQCMPSEETTKRTTEQTPSVSVKVMKRVKSEETNDRSEITSLFTTSFQTSCISSRSASITGTVYHYYYRKNRRFIFNGDASSTAKASSQLLDFPQKHSKPGVVITSARQSNRRSSNSSAAEAFAIATSGSGNPRDISPNSKESRKEIVLSNPSTMRVLTVLRHWISKHFQDFQKDMRLKSMAIEFLEDVFYCPNFLPAEHKTANYSLQLLRKHNPDRYRIDVFHLIAPPATPTKENIETLSALEIAEQMTYLDHRIFFAISSEEFLGLAWMKSNKAVKAPYILLMTRHFNHVSRLVASEILRRTEINARIAIIEKWTAVADIARCLHNFNGVLQICSAFTNSAVFRLKLTWDKVSKTTKQTIEKLQAVVSSDGRFRALRDALHKCDPPCIPYLGLYLTDLSFIEEGTPTFVEDGLVNFSKMRMIAHVIREILHFQQTSYKIELDKRVTHYLLDTSVLLDDDDLYSRSLEIEPRTSRLSMSGPSQMSK